MTTLCNFCKILMCTIICYILILIGCAIPVGFWFAGAKIQMMIAINRYGDAYNTSTGCISAECDNKHKISCYDPYYANCNVGGIMATILLGGTGVMIYCGIIMAICRCYENLTRKRNKECDDTEITQCDKKNKITEDNDDVIVLSTNGTDTSNTSSCVNISTSTM